MFTGIVECTAIVKSAVAEPDRIRLLVEKPSNFNDLSVGDSICTDGVCLTVESFDDQQIEFVAAAETLQITGWNSQELQGRFVNLERSMRLGDRIHGHLVSGHVETTARIFRAEKGDDSLFFEIETPNALRALIWKKGSVALNGVSLTVNEVTAESFSVLLIPETIKRTNLSDYNMGDRFNIEGDYFAKGLAAIAETQMRGQQHV